MILTSEFIFWLTIAGILAVYSGYPLLLCMLARVQRRHSIDDTIPTVSLVISAYNEESVIVKKLENSLAIHYPQKHLEIIVISDESTDSTDQLVASFDNRHIVLYRQEPRAGKTSGLSRFVPETHGEIIVFSDANSMYEPDAIRKLVRNFADPNVGYVVGQQRYEKDCAEISVAESLYWKYESWLKERETRLGSVVGGDGAIYAIRRSLFKPLRPDDISDFTLPLMIVADGFRGIYEPEAICYERTASSFGGEFRRKIRIVNRSLRAVTRVPQVLNPFRVGVFSLQLFLHKVLRWFAPFFLVGALTANGWLVLDKPNTAAAPEFYAWCLGLQLAFYCLGALKFVPGLGRARPVYLVYFFCMANVAAGIGVLRQLFGRTISIWTPDRPEAEWPSLDVPIGETRKSV